MPDIQVVVLTGYGLNCDHETAYAFEQAGATANRVHIHHLIDGSISLHDYHIMVFTGGFSWGDDHGAGVLEAIRLKSNIGDDITQFIEDGKLIIGICNGFQAMVNMGLLPGIDNYHTRSVALTYNDCGNFRNDWVTLRIDPDSSCVFTKGIQTIDLPIRHGEGKFYAEQNIIETLLEQKQVVMQYADKDGNLANNTFPDNPNGSFCDIAGICDITGRVFGLMPHPEAYNHWTNHPNWTRLRENKKRNDLPVDSYQKPMGTILFTNAVNYMLENYSF